MPEEPTSSDSIVLTGNPVKDLRRCLEAAVMCSRKVQDTIQLMEIPNSKWRLRSFAMSNTMNIETSLNEMLTGHARVEEDLKTLGY